MDGKVDNGTEAAVGIRLEGLYFLTRLAPMSVDRETDTAAARTGVWIEIAGGSGNRRRGALGGDKAGEREEEAGDEGGE
jgi:hypothetical protein